MSLGLGVARRVTMRSEVVRERGEKIGVNHASQISNVKREAEVSCRFGSVNMRPLYEKG